MTTTIRPKDEPAATSVAAGDIFLIDGTTGVRGLDASKVAFRNAANTFTGTQTVGALVATSINGNTFTASTGVLTIAGGKSFTASNSINLAGVDNKTLTINNSLTLVGADGTVQTFPSTSGTVVTSVSSNVVTNAMRAQMGAATLKMNATAGTANVTDSTIQGLTNLAAPSGTLDFLPIFDHVSGTIKNVTPGAIASSSVAGVASLNTATGAIALSVVVQKFTASGTYTPTAGMKYAIIECVGPGGGGGGVANGGANTSSSGTGGSGAWSRAKVTAAAVGASKAVTVGTGGAGGAAAAGSGAAGSGATSVGALCVANPGGGGSGVTSGAGAGVGGTGGSASGIGDLSYSGVPGQSGFNSSVITTSISAANGPSTPYGTGGKAAAVSTAPGACDGWGGGGAAVSVANSSGNIAGGAGGDGGVLITEYVIS